jgi:TRAP-type C4-dicarboxylate transport system substrate-binding protein
MAAMTARTRLRTFACLGVAAIVAAGCTGGAGGGDKAGGAGEPIVLTMANGYGSSPSTTDPLQYEPAVAYFVSRVGELSGGEVRIQVVDDWGNQQPGFEQQIVHDVATGKADLAWVGTRIFDTLGINSFQALNAPMLIDNYPLERAVIASDMPGEMLESLSTLRVTGLAVLGDGLRKPIAVDAPLLGPADWQGISFQVFRSTGQAEAIRALGAQPNEIYSGKIVQTEVRGAERNLHIYQVALYSTQFPYVTANVNLWPQTVALLANPTRLSGLTEEQRGWVRRAAADASVSSTGMFEDETATVQDVCLKGARFANASVADVAAMRQAFVPVYDSLERDPPTEAFIERIDALKLVTPAGRAVAIPAGCTGSTGGLAADPLAGTWHTGHITPSQWLHRYIAMGGSEKEGHESFGPNQPYKIVTLRFQDGVFRSYCGGEAAVRGLDQAEVDALLASGSPPELCGFGIYEIGDDSTVVLHGDFTDTYRYELNGDTLRLHFVKGDCGPDCGPAWFAMFPFTRSR